MVSKVEDLIVYNKAYGTALALHKISLNFPQIEQFALGNQIRRSSKGICANIAEGFGKQHKSTAEFKRFLLMALGSSEETKVWINFCKDLSYIDKKEAMDFWSEYDEISKMLNGLMKGWKED